MGRRLRVGVLDVGSTAAQLAVFDLVPGKRLRPRGSVKRPTRLTQSLQPNGRLGATAIARVSQAVASCMKEARSRRLDEVIAVGTSVIRDAPNADKVVSRVRRATGIALGFLDGQVDAELTFAAARAWYGKSAGRMLVADIGGGSVELAYGAGQMPEVALSLPLGARRLTQQYLPQDPPRPRHVRALRHLVASHVTDLADVLSLERGVDHAVAASRTFTQLAVLTGAPDPTQAPCQLDHESLSTQVGTLAGMSAEDRARLPGISRPRAHQIAAGAIVADGLLDALALPTLTICPWALREGIALHRLSALTNKTAPTHIEHLIHHL